MTRIDLPVGEADTILVQLIGTLSVHCQGRALVAAEIGDRRARTLLALLAIQPGRTVAMDRVIEVLWEAATLPRHPTANVATLVSRLRRRLGVGVIDGDRRYGFRLESRVRVDLQEAARLVQSAESLLAEHHPAQALGIAQQTVGLLEQAVVLTDAPLSDWVRPARLRQDQVLRRARHIAGTAALSVGDVQAAIVTGCAAVAADRFDEVAHRMLMCAHYASHEPALALLTYERLRTTLADELGTDPAAATRDLQLAILKNDTLPGAVMQAILRPGAVAA